MQPIKDPDKVARMFSQGQTSLIDTSTGYKYTMVAFCPQDGSPASVAQTEKTSDGLSRVVFRCPRCSAMFEAGPEDIHIR